ncbi:MATE family efflux transporter [Cloacibacillus sp. An23]|uniref:MATE family efflux transporter n=1 Tax=Cloacibacillus sp. An23 TaxID=1965591 RepID=UPI000B3A26BA|nr:MATE family efflux transporter [Cloacibacillus sp. An23]OUO94079.1 hypothetical protein B5F39_05280 [Cloacibacillus sp. An23]
MGFMKNAKGIFFHRGPVDLGGGHVLQSLARLSVPSIGMVLFQTLFNLVDTIFISWLGESHMVAISYTFPVQIGVFALLEGVGNGVTALVGRRLGESDIELARKTARFGLAFSYVLSLVWLPFLFPGPSNAFFSMLGASDPETLRQAWLYNMWIPPMTFVISFTYIVNSIFRCQGDTMTPLRFFVVANGLNFVLDPLFIFVFGWGMTGAAAATFIGRVAGAVYLIKKMRRGSAIQIPLFVRPRREMLPVWRAVAAIGLPVTLSTGSVALGMGSVNRVLTEAYGNVAIAGWMISLRIEDLAFGTLMGVSNALVPFIAFNYGRRSFARIKEGIRAAFVICCCVTLTICFLLALYPWPAIGLFRPSPDVAHAAVRSLRITMAGYPFAMYGMIYNALFIAAGSSVYGFIVQMGRCMFFRLPMAWFLAATVSMSWVWLFQPLSFLCAAVMTFAFAATLMKKLKKELAGPLSAE